MLTKFDEYFILKRNVIHERASFHQQNQNSGESVQTFFRSLYEWTEECDFIDKEEQIRDRLVIGLFDRLLSEDLQLQADLTLDNTIQILVCQSQLARE